MVPGRRMGIDFGLARIGIAISDPGGGFSFPLEMIETPIWEKSLLPLIEEYQPRVIYIGYPLHLSGSQSTTSSLVEDFARELAQLYSGLIYLIDERLTSKSAAVALRESGKGAKESKNDIDMAAASILLELALSIEKNTGLYAGRSLESEI
jgi:putative Holliday junction resolvase